MSARGTRFAAAALSLVAVAGLFSYARGHRADQTLLAATPPMGWNSWDGYGTTITEPEFRANADWMSAHLKSAGWQYVTVDMEWFVTNATPAGNSKESKFAMDDFGRYIPAPNRFPSSADGAGFKPLAAYVHSLGLKFGIHILSGIPKEAVERNLPIAGSPYHAKEAANTSVSCPWNPDNFGADASSPASQAYFDSIANLYASWDVDFVKVDCIASRPYRGDEIRMISTALAKSGRPMILSLSPGAAPVEKLDELRKYSQMWRISDDIWDLWHSDVPYPQGLGDQFANVAKWAGMARPGAWPDADMLPLGYLGPRPGWGQARQTRLTHFEQRTLVSLWSIFPSPLMVGGDLTKADPWTTSLLTNPEVLEVDQHSTENHPVLSTANTVIWLARATTSDENYLAVFNLENARRHIAYSWRELSLAGDAYRLRDLWEHSDAGVHPQLDVTLEPHASVLYKLQPVAAPAK